MKSTVTNQYIDLFIVTTKQINLRPWKNNLIHNQQRNNNRSSYCYA